MSDDKQDRVFYLLHDEVIFQIRELLQLAMLTDTNLVDHMRQLRFEPSKDENHFLMLTPEYKEYHNNIIGKMLEQINALNQELGKEVSSTMTEEIND